MWLNKLVKYQNKPIFIEEFYSVGIYDFQQLITSHGQLKSYDELANEFGMRANNNAFIKYIKLIAAIPTKWIQNLSLTSNFDCFKNNVTQFVFSLTTCKKVYCLLIEKTKILPKNSKISGVINCRSQLILSIGKIFMKTIITLLTKSN